jgi:hypothetical protein
VLWIAPSELCYVQADAEAMSLQSSEVIGTQLQQQAALQRQAPTSMAGSMAAPGSLHHHAGTELPDNVSVCCSLESASALSAGNKSALLAETVFTTFKSRLQKLQVWATARVACCSKRVASGMQHFAGI